MLSERPSSKHASLKNKRVKTAVMLAAALLGSAALYRRLIVSQTADELSDRHENYRAFGYAGFQFVNAPMTWDQAHHWCYNHGMVLATVDEPWKKDLILKVSENKDVWVGYRSFGALTDKESWKWMSGAETDWANWDSGEPNNRAGEACAHQTGDGELRNHMCSSQKFPFVCDRSPFILGYAMHGVSGEGLTFDEADAECRARYGTTLATLGDAETMRFIIKQTQAPRAWVGLRIQPGIPWHPNSFTFMSREPKTHPFRWATNQPTMGKNYRCVQMNNNGRLADRSCMAKLKWFMCDQFTGNSLALKSSVEINGDLTPEKNSDVPSKLILYDGRTKYRMVFKIKILAVQPNWGSIIHIGNENLIRLPAVFLWKNNLKKLLFSQSSLPTGNIQSCIPNMSMIPAIGQWLSVQLFSVPESFQVRFDGKLSCNTQLTMKPPSAMQKVWLGNPWHDQASVQISQLRFDVV